MKSDNTSKRIKEIKKSIEGFITREEMHNYVDEKVKNLRDELLALIKALEERLKTKVDMDDITRVEQSLLSKLEEVV